MQNKDYLKKIDENKDEMLKTLQELVAIPSVNAPAEGDMPFGKGVQQSLEYMLKKAEKDGFETYNADNYGGHIDFGGRIFDENGEVTELSDQTMGILAHLDVVPEGSDWDFDPYGGEIKDGKMYGRGTSDDKGPLIAAYYAMRALKECGYEPQKKVRVVLGLDEETGWKGMHYYLKQVPPVDFGFTPDGEFPATYGEMGLLVFEIAKKIGKTNNKGLRFRNMTGGNAPNMVADSAKVLLFGDSYTEVKEKLESFKKETGHKLSSKGRGKSLEISAEGVSAHGAMPWKGLSAISILMQFMENAGIVNEDILDFINFYNNHIAFELDGTSIGCGFTDEISGKLVFNVGMVKIDEEAARITVNIRYPLSIKEDQIFDGMKPVLDKYNLGIVKQEHKAPLYVPKDSPLITTLMDVYREFTGDEESEPMVIGGGTYSRSMPGTVAFGMLFPGEIDVMHQKNEFVPIDSLMKAAKIYCECIYRLTDAVKVPEGNK